MAIETDPAAWSSSKALACMMQWASGQRSHANFFRGLGAEHMEDSPVAIAAIEARLGEADAAEVMKWGAVAQAFAAVETKARSGAKKGDLDDLLTREQYGLGQLTVSESRVVERAAAAFRQLKSNGYVLESYDFGEMAERMEAIGGRSR